MAMSASSAAGSNYFGGAAGGVAPGASIVATTRGINISSSRFVESLFHHAVEALLAGAVHPRVDVIMYYRAQAVPNDGRAVLDIVTHRVMEVYGKPVVQSAGNAGPAVGTVCGSGGDVLTVGAYTARAAWRANFGTEIGDAGRVRSYSGRGPSEDGAPGVSFLAPSGFVSADLSLTTGPRRLNSSVPYLMPKGYMVGDGTSQATPAAAGAVALLISGAKQTRVRYDPRRIAVALLSSAQPLEGYGAHEQGAGVINVGTAWQMLKRLVDDPPQIETEGPVRTAWSDRLEKPGRGRGLYERGGWRVGQREARTITLRRVSGPRGARSYALSWSSNDGTYESPASVTLPLDVSVAVNVTIHPKSAGIHSAMLNVIDPKTGALLHHMLHTIIVAEPLTAANRHTFRQEGKLDLLRASSFFLEVPERAGRLRVRLRSREWPITLGVAPPLTGYGTPFTASPPPAACTETKAKGANSGVEMVCTVERPEDGVCEAYVEYPSPWRADLQLKSLTRPTRYSVTASVKTLSTGRRSAAVPSGPRRTAQGQAIKRINRKSI